MRVDLFDYDLPEELIAQEPLRPREAARLLHVGKDLTDRHVADLPDYFANGDVVVLNDTRVLPTRFLARRGKASVEVTLVQPHGNDSWWAFAKPGKRLRVGDTVTLAPDLDAQVMEKSEDGRISLRFALCGHALIERIKAHGRMPLPPYIRRRPGDVADAADAADGDREAYQTVFARHDGAVAAPTASLHLSQAMLQALEQKGVELVYLTLHVGIGTFLPVKVEDTDDHRMHAEWMEITKETALRINAARNEGRPITAIGTTALRALEAAGRDGRIVSGPRTTDLFITPGFSFQYTDRLLTNFHLPRSTLLMLVSAFSGMDRIKAAYAHAIAQRYRFFSYGDTSLLERHS